MTEQDLKLYRLNARVMLLERVFASISIGLLMKAGATIEQARSELAYALEREGMQIEVELPRLSRGDPALNALLQEEFREILDDLRSLIRSYK